MQLQERSLIVWEESSSVEESESSDPSSEQILVWRWVVRPTILVPVAYSWLLLPNVPITKSIEPGDTQTRPQTQSRRKGTWSMEGTSAVGEGDQGGRKSVRGGLCRSILLCLAFDSVPNHDHNSDSIYFRVSPRHFTTHAISWSLKIPATHIYISKLVQIMNTVIRRTIQQ